jgi:hypothetical protein
MNFKLYFIFVALAFSTTDISAQLNLSKYELGVNVGSYVYQGDLTPSYAGAFKTPGIAIGIQLSRQLTKSIMARVEFNLGRLRGDDSKYSDPAWRSQRNFSFESTVNEFALSMVWIPSQFTGRLKPYLFAGAGMAFVNVTRDYSNYNSEYFAGEPLTAQLDEDLATPLPRHLPVIPVGVGLRYAISERISVVPEASLRYISNDYLDGYSKSGDPNKNDKFFKYTIGLTYSFGKKSQYACPVLIR